MYQPIFEVLDNFIILVFETKINALFIESGKPL